MDEIMPSYSLGFVTPPENPGRRAADLKIPVPCPKYAIRNILRGNLLFFSGGCFIIRDLQIGTEKEELYDYNRAL